MNVFLPPNDPLLVKRAEEVLPEEINPSRPPLIRGGAPMNFPPKKGADEGTHRLVHPEGARLLDKGGKLEGVFENMLHIAHGEQKDAKKPVMVGLAAPQIGISKRIILVDINANGKRKLPLEKGGWGDLKVYLNPEIIWQSDEENEWYEGCYSTSNVCGIVSRPTKIKIRALNREGESIEEEHEGYTARIFQHEIDHLNGKVFVDLITDDDKLHWVEKDEFSAYRDNEGWRNWPRKCSWERWVYPDSSHQMYRDRDEEIKSYLL